VLNVARQSLVNTEEDILRQILGFRAVTGKAVTDIEHAPMVLNAQVPPRPSHLLEALLDQLDVLLQRFISLESQSPLRPSEYGTKTAAENSPCAVTPGPTELRHLTG